MSEPTYRCKLCGRVQRVDYFARGFPPDAAKRKLVKWCKANDCPCDPEYTAGFRIGGPITGQSDLSCVVLEQTKEK